MRWRSAPGGCVVGSEHRPPNAPRRRPVEIGSLLEHGPLEVAQRRSRFDADVVGEAAADGVARPQRLGLAAAAVEGEYPLSAEPLTQRMLSDEAVELVGQGLVVAADELGVDAVLDGVEPGVGEPGRLRRKIRTERDTAERFGAAPETERLAQRRGGAGGVVGDGAAPAPPAS